MRASWASAVTVIAAVAITASVTSAASGKSSEGKAIFLKYKCTSCHSIEAEGIVKKAVVGEPAETTTSKHKPPDLSSVGLDKKADWITGFLLKKEMLDGEHHMKKFRGTDKELSTLASWLESMKTPSKAKAKVEKAEKAEAGEKSDKSEKSEAGEKSDQVESSPKSDSTGAASGTK